MGALKLPDVRAGRMRRLTLLIFHLALLPAFALGQQPDLASDAGIGGNVDSGDGHAIATIIGTVEDTNGNVVPGATATLTRTATTEQHTATANDNGFFSLSVNPGPWELAVSAPGLTSWMSSISIGAGEYHEIKGIVLNVNSLVSTVRVRATRVEIAEAQIHAQEHQRVLGVLPNFFVSYVPEAAPLTAKQKFELTWKNTVDPISFAEDGLDAAVEQARNEYAAYGQGTLGYAKRFGAAYANDASSNMIGGALLPIVFHQDPRYFYRGTGSVISRALYAVSTVAICKGDNGRWEPNYSFVLGNFASGAISNLYYPADNRGWGMTLENGAMTTLMGTTGSLLQEFVMRRFSHGVPAAAGQSY